MTRSDEPADHIVLAQTCDACSCPTIYAGSHPDEVLVQGYTYDMPTPDGEQVVRIPRSLMVDALSSEIEDRS